MAGYKQPELPCCATFAAVKTIPASVQLSNAKG
jgi:hypothetical protein